MLNTVKKIKEYETKDIGEFLKPAKKANKSLRRKKYSKVIEYLLLYLEKNLNSAEILNNLMVSYNKLGKYNEAIETSKTLLEIEPNNKNALNNLFFAYDQKGDYNKALEILR